MKLAVRVSINLPLLHPSSYQAKKISSTFSGRFSPVISWNPFPVFPGKLFRVFKSRFPLSCSAPPSLPENSSTDSASLRLPLLIYFLFLKVSRHSVEPPYLRIPAASCEYPTFFPEVHYYFEAYCMQLWKLISDTPEVCVVHFRRPVSKLCADTPEARCLDPRSMLLGLSRHAAEPVKTRYEDHLKHVEGSSRNSLS